ncbi:MAG: tryptophan synthase subunit alpha [Candidatus Altiarchaeales archaeon]|nr:tryptophan synthase subunit alpha [Candidatus Altiarchaeales archaeon]
MNRIDKKFAELRKRNEKGFIGFITAGDPDFNISMEIADSVIKGGVDILEFGLPFSDPIADGPVIQKASQRSLNAGMNSDKFFEFVGKIREKHSLPLVCMTYYNLVLHRGLQKFALDCKKFGVDGLIIPDLPIEESRELMNACSKNDVRLIFLVAPTTTEKRLKAILESAKGFVYVVSLRGITGVRKQLSADLKPLLARIRKLNKKIPLAVGFGVSTAEHVKQITESGADAAIVGSALIKVIEENLGQKEVMLKKLEKLAKDMKESTA